MPNTNDFSVVQSQLEYLDDTDIYATAWSDALTCAREKNLVSWGGRGQGGRGVNRRTFQPSDVVVPSVRLEYVAAAAATETVLLLEHAHLKLLAGHVYALSGKNGCGKSSLLRRMNAGKIPGFPPHVSTLYISQDEDNAILVGDLSAVEWVMQRYHAYCRDTVQVAGRAHIVDLEAAMEALDMDGDLESATKMDALADAISALEDELVAENAMGTERQAEDALRCMGIDALAGRIPLRLLTEGQRKKISLGMALLCCRSASCDLLLLDEPTKALDVPGLLQLRQLVEIVSTTCTSGGQRCTTIVLVSHDYDFINDVATDVIEFHNRTLLYYAGNYADFQIQREQLERSELRQASTLEKKQEAMKQTLENLKKQPVPKRGGGKKKSRTITCHKKKMDRVLGITANANVRLQRKWYEDEPDKAIQFKFRNCTSQWNEPLIVAMDLGFGYEIDRIVDLSSTPLCEAGYQSSFPVIVKKDGFLFDSIDLCIHEGGCYCILGESASGKSTLLKILAKLIDPVEGKVLHAHNVDVAFLDQSHAHDIINAQSSGATALQHLSKRFPEKTEQEIRGELTAFGLSTKRTLATDVRFLSGGERCRLAMAAAMLGNPQVLCLDNPTANLDVDSVEALIYGLQHWNGTVVMVSHDAHFLRSLEALCYVLNAEEGKLRRVEKGGVDAYLRSFGTNNKF